MSTTKTERPGYPLFQLFSVSQIAATTGYSESTLLDIKLGYRPATGAFRRKMAAGLKKPETELFGEAAA